MMEAQRVLALFVEGQWINCNRNSNATKKWFDKIEKMEETGMLTCIKSQRQRNAAEYALKVIQSSCIKPYIQSIYLYGSCARGEEKYSSDVDLFL